MNPTRWTVTLNVRQKKDLEKNIRWTNVTMGSITELKSNEVRLPLPISLLLKLCGFQHRQHEVLKNIKGYKIDKHDHEK